MTKKLLFDLLSAQPCGNTKFHGGGEYIKTVLKKLLEDYSEFIKIEVFYDKSKFLDEWLLEIISLKRVRVYDVDNINDVERILDLNNFDIFYSGLPYTYTEKMFPNPIKKIGTFHGLRPIECPGDDYEFAYINGNGIKNKIKKLLYSVYWSRNFLNERLKHRYKVQYIEAFRTFDKCIVVSEHTKYAVSNYFQEYGGKIEVCYSPAKESDIKQSSDVIKCRYILIISADRWLKNSYRALCALDDMYERNLLGDIKVVVVGVQDNNFSKVVKNRSNFQFKNYVTAEELEALYKNCSVFLYPTLNEGFGYPPLEAMKYGRTCVVSAVCSLPEICGEAVYYINPYDLGEMQTRILEALENPISEDVILLQRNKILHRQNLDLEKLCEIIVDK